ncbi:uncharacterized protein LOC111121664 [Crassostrea virginica]|uniref:Uncharacterized protein LOC111121664 n=1 Tax=Crassostrea virginica TaxID=6565 RepID=A0A8B8CSE7_CRAVI|nr:uncharacterized protein LOC111121664 [Crassostrea virginica]
MTDALFLLVLSAGSALVVWGYPSYLPSLPVDYVPHVCRDMSGQYHFYNVSAIGHEFCDAPYFERNGFGMRFNLMQQNNQQWADICPEDTDSDGRTNGAEMGDPDCTWAPCSATNGNCVKLTAVSHPGIPEYTETVGTSDEYVAECSIMCLGFPMQ